MASIALLAGFELIGCTRANSPKEVEVAALRCGYDAVPAFDSFPQRSPGN